MLLLITDVTICLCFHCTFVYWLCDLKQVEVNSVMLNNTADFSARRLCTEAELFSMMKDLHSLSLPKKATDEEQWKVYSSLLQVERSSENWGCCRK